MNSPPAGRSRRFWPDPHRVKLRARDQAHVFRQLEILLSSGVLIAEALDQLKARYPDRRTRRVLAAVHAEVTASRLRLSRALALFPRSFPPATVAVLEAGEQSGAARLAELCGDLAERIAYVQANREQLRRACAYPALALAMAAGLGALLLAVVFPRLDLLLGSLGGRLPPLARGLVAAGQLCREHWAAALAGVGSLALGGAALRRWPAAARCCDRALLRLPVAGPIQRHLSVSLVCRIYRSLYCANRPAPEIMVFCSEAVGNACFREGLLEAGRKIARGGGSTAQALERSGLFPPLACLAIEVGERAGHLAAALDRVADYHGRLARERIDLAIGALNPALTLLVVSGVGIILLSFFQAMYQVAYAVR